MTKRDTVAIVPISSSKFLSLIPSDDFSVLAHEGLMLYSTDKSTHFNPLVLWKKGENILVTLQEDIQEDKLVALFGDEDVTPDATYSFPEDELMALVEDEPELLPDIVALLEENPETASADILELLTSLKNEGFSVIHILQTLASISSPELARLIFLVKEMRTFLRQYFIQLFCGEQNSSNEEE